MAKCKYYRESPIEQYTLECMGESEAVHPDDITEITASFAVRR